VIDHTGVIYAMGRDVEYLGFIAPQDAPGSLDRNRPATTGRIAHKGLRLTAESRPRSATGQGRRSGHHAHTLAQPLSQQTSGRRADGSLECQKQGGSNRFPNGQMS
jgi:hypothetical protein